MNCQDLRAIKVTRNLDLERGMLQNRQPKDQTNYGDKKALPLPIGLSGGAKG
jgi:hypothetical protein